MMFAGIVQEICGTSCDAGETILGLALILGFAFGGVVFMWLIFHD